MNPPPPPPPPPQIWHFLAFFSDRIWHETVRTIWQPCIGILVYITPPPFFPVKITFYSPSVYFTSPPLSANIREYQLEYVGDVVENVRKWLATTRQVCRRSFWLC